MPYKDREIERAYRKAYYEKHREYLSARKKARYAADPAVSIERTQRYRTKNRALYLAHCKEYSAAYQTKHKDDYASYQAAYKAAHLVEHAESEARRRARKRQTAAEKIDFMQILRASNGLCGICRQPLDLFGIDFDHVIPLSRGGTHTAGNIQPSHARCNRKKGAKVAAS